MQDNELYYNRRLYITTCPVCEKFLAELVQRRKEDKEVVRRLFKANKAEKIYEKSLSEVIYKYSDLPKKQKNTFGLCYGEYTEKVKDGKVVKIIEKAKDFYGNTKTLKTYNT